MTDRPPASEDLPRQIGSAADLGKLVRFRRNARKLTQADLAAAAGVGRRFVVELEQGKPSVELDKALRVARQLGIQLGLDPFSQIAEMLAQYPKHMEEAVSKVGKAMQTSLKGPQFRLPQLEPPSDPANGLRAKPRSDETESS